MFEKSFIGSEQKKRKKYYGMEYIATGQDTDGQYFLSECNIPGNDNNTPMHLHSHEDEAFYILKGKLVFEIENEKITAVAGSFIHVPKNSRHRFYNPSEKEASMLILFVPSGIEQMFKEMNELPADEENNAAALNAISVKYGTTYFAEGE